MDLSQKSVSYAQDRRDWLGSQHGTDAPRSISLDVSKFTANTHYPDGFLKSGIALGKIAATGLYGPYAGRSSEVQTVTVTGVPTGGTFTLTFGTQTTAAIAYNATAAAVKTALEALSNVGVGDVTTTGGALPGTAVVVTFTGAFSGIDVPQLTATATLTGGTTPAVAVTTGTAGGTGAASDGREVCVGFLFTGVEVIDRRGRASTQVGGSMLVHGFVNVAKLPVTIDASGLADVASRIYTV